MPDTTTTSQVIAATHDAAKFVLPTASDQWSAVFNAPIPFSLAVAAVMVVLTTAIWKAFKWRYDGVIEKKQATIDQTQSLVELAKADAGGSKEKVTELTATIKKLESKIETLTKEAKEAAMGAKPSPTLAEVGRLVATATAQVTDVSTANNAVSQSLSRIPYTGTPLPLTAASNAAPPGLWQSPNPPEKPDQPKATSGSG
jgi:F0F1-type ATP synthase membrane subunit b/b'